MIREKAQAASIARPKVPMRWGGADCLVAALRRRSGHGAKGAGHRHWVGATGNGRSPTINGRRQPSSGGTSWMMREYHVQICEGLGVKLPGPTRQERKSPAGSNDSATAYPLVEARLTHQRRDGKQGGLVCRWFRIRPCTWCITRAAFRLHQ